MSLLGNNELEDLLMQGLCVNFETLNLTCQKNKTKLYHPIHVPLMDLRFKSSKWELIIKQYCIQDAPLKIFKMPGN